MHTLNALVIVLALVGAASAQEGPVPTVSPSVRPLDARGERILARGLAGSTSLRALVDEVSLLRAVAYVQMDSYLPLGLRGTTRLMGVSGDIRRMVVLLNPRASDDDLVAMLAHELQHVAEMARAGVTTTAEVEAHYRRHGIVGPVGRYETTAALAAGSRVQNELAASARRETHLRGGTIVLK